METRKVQVTGGSTYTVSIPKDWALDNEIQAGDTVAFYREGSTLLLTSEPRTENTRGTLDISELAGEELVRAIMTMYVSGFDVIELESPRIMTDQRQSIRTATQSLVSMEVLEETSDRVVIQDLLNAGELSVLDALTRMQRITVSMLEDALVALLEDNDELSRSVIARDDDVDRLWFVISRTFRSTLRSPLAIEEFTPPREVCFDYHTSARQLERIADHAVKIAQTALELEDIPGEIGEALTTFKEEAVAIITTSMDALLADDSERAIDLANDARESVLAIDTRNRDISEALCELDSEYAQYLGLVVDSLSRSVDYGDNIAETALQKAFPRPHGQ